MFVIIILLILLFFSITSFILVSCIARAQYIRANKYEKMIDDYDAILDEFGKDVTTTYQRLRHIDDKQMFEKDDDVGVLFQNIVQIIEKFNEKTNIQLSR